MRYSVVPGTFREVIWRVDLLDDSYESHSGAQASAAN